MRGGFIALFLNNGMVSELQLLAFIHITHLYEFSFIEPEFYPGLKFPSIMHTCGISPDGFVFRSRTL